MAILLNSSSAIRRFGILALVFVVVFLLLRSSAYNSYTDYLPTIKSPFSSSEYDPSSVSSTPPTYDDGTIPQLGAEYDEAPNFSTQPVENTPQQEPPVDEMMRPEDLFGKPEDILPEIQELPELETQEQEDEQDELELEQEQNDEFNALHPDETTTEEWKEEQSQDRPVSSPRSRLNLEMQELLAWDPPVENTKHYPPYDAYGTRDYDPNRWEGFEQNIDIYVNGTTDKLPHNLVTPAEYNIYPSYNSADWLQTFKGEYVSCDGPAGVPYNESADDDFVRAFRAMPEGFPKPDVGSYLAVGLDGDVCFDRHSRLDSYRSAGDHEELNWSQVKWGRLQNGCLVRNSERYRDSNIPALKPSIARLSASSQKSQQDSGNAYSDANNYRMEQENEDLTARISPRQISDGLQHQSRSAVLIRTWDTYDYKDNDHMAIRSLISELSLQSGGEYQVYLFVHVKDASIPIFDNLAVYAEKLEEYVPEEFRDIAILWNEDISKSWYSEVGEWSVYFQQWMPIQWFSKTHPEFDFIWNWEMDARYIGNHYHFVEQISNFATKQPRKYLWERNSRFFIPAVHGNWDEFVEHTNDIVASSPYVHTIWGADPAFEDQKILGPSPPTSEHDDHFEWGVGEQADLITLLPMWDPRDTMWAYRNKLWGYESPENAGDVKPFPQIPRRAFINTLVRLSTRLLDAMHEENEQGRSMAAEMWPSSISLQHGFKAVYAPHPIWLANKWPGEYLDAIINADGWGAGSSGSGGVDGGRGAAFDEERELHGLPQEGTGPNREGKAGRWGAERDSPYSPDREHNFGGWSWYFWSDFPKTLYWRWLGWQSTFTITANDGDVDGKETKEWNWSEYESQHGRLCLPGMLIHPVKNVSNPTSPPPPSFAEIAEQTEDEDRMPVDGLPEDNNAVANPYDLDASSPGGDRMPVDGLPSLDSLDPTDTSPEQEDYLIAAAGDAAAGGAPDDSFSTSIIGDGSTDGFGATTGFDALNAGAPSFADAAVPPAVAAAVADTFDDPNDRPRLEETGTSTYGTDFANNRFPTTDDTIDVGRPAAGFPIDVSPADITAAANDDAADLRQDDAAASELDPSRPFAGLPDTNYGAAAAPPPPLADHNSYFDDGSRMPPKQLDAILPGDASWRSSRPSANSPVAGDAVDAETFGLWEDSDAGAAGAGTGASANRFGAANGASYGAGGGTTGGEYADTRVTADTYTNTNTDAGSDSASADYEDFSTTAPISSPASERLRPGEVSDDAYSGAFDGVADDVDAANDDGVGADEYGGADVDENDGVTRARFY